ncbi:MAG: lipoyl(octanoyl) transferase LipB [Candidatus Promineifilaceae bacterium]
MKQKLDIEFLGRIDYGRAWDLQKELVEARTADPDLPDKLLLLEHPPTYTLGRHGGEENLIYSEAERAEKGIALYHVDRGGDVTYHGPGQLVGYPILNLEHRYGKGIGRTRRYVAGIESILIEALKAFAIDARPYEGFRGVWVEENGVLNKIAAIGVYVNRMGISSHGFALNVKTDLAYFEGIIPCGIQDHDVTSMSRTLGQEITIEDVLPQIVQSFTAVFDYELQPEGTLYAND